MDYNDKDYCEKCGYYISDDEEEEEGDSLDEGFDDRVKAFFGNLANLGV